jgi:ABC-type uncharacterized transport system substrate-binding protein
VPELFHRLVIDRIPDLVAHNPREFAIVKVRVERFQPIDLLPHGRCDRTDPCPVHHLDIGGEESQHALLAEAAPELPHGLRMGVGFLSPLGGGPIGKQDQRTNHLVPPLDLIYEPQLQLGKRRRRFHISDGLAGSHAVKVATQTIPIIFTGVGDPVAGDLVPSLTQLSGNLTGVTNIPDHAFFATHLALLREAVPDLTRVALLLYADNPFRTNKIPPVELAAKAVGIDLHLVDVATPDGFEAAFAAMRRQGVGGLLVSFTPFLTTYRAQIAALAAKHRLPAIAHNRPFVEHGGLMAYGWDRAELWRGVVSYLDRILHSAKPADLPVQQPTKFELVINLKTAQALDLTIPPALLFQADEVIR